MITKKERTLEIEQVTDLIKQYLLESDGRVKNRGGGRFEKNEKVYENRMANGEASGSMMHDGGDNSNVDENTNFHDINKDLTELDMDCFIDRKTYLTDISTLFLNAIIYRLNKVLGFETLLLMSKSGKSLYLCIKASYGDLKVHAQIQQYSLTLDIGYSDIASLEPCDQYLNPLSKVRPPDDLKHSISHEEKKLKKLLTTIDQINRDGEETDAEYINEIAEEFDADDVYVNPNIPVEIWKNYIKFTQVLCTTLENGINDESFDLCDYKAGMFVGQAYISALKYVNLNVDDKKYKLQNLWDRQGKGEAVGATTNYVRKINERQEDEFDKFWVRHEINERHDRSIFSNSDKFKIMDAAIQQVFLIQHLISYGYVDAYFPLHDRYELTGWVRGEPKLDPISEGYKKCMGEEVYKTIESKREFVIPAWRKSMKCIFKPPINLIRRYFGEKIAFYFDFLSFYTSSLVITCPVGIVLFIIYFATSRDSDGTKVLMVSFINMNSPIDNLCNFECSDHNHFYRVYQKKRERTRRRMGPV